MDCILLIFFLILAHGLEAMGKMLLWMTFPAKSQLISFSYIKFSRNVLASVKIISNVSVKFGPESGKLP